MVMHNLNKPNSDAKQQLGNISRKIAQCVTELASAAELLKDDDWVDPSDPTFIAENELLGAAKSIDNAAKKLAALKPRGEIKGKVGIFLMNAVRRHFIYLSIIPQGFENVTNKKYLTTYLISSNTCTSQNFRS